VEPKPEHLTLADLAASKHYNLEIKKAETPDERKARLRREDDAANHARAVERDRTLQDQFKERIFLIAGIAALGMSLLISVGVLIFSSRAELHTWATGAISAVSGGFIGYLTAKKDK